MSISERLRVVESQVDNIDYNVPAREPYLDDID